MKRLGVIKFKSIKINIAEKKMVWFHGSEIIAYISFFIKFLIM